MSNTDMYLQASGKVEFNGLRIDPGALFFRNVYKGMTYHSTITMINISANPIMVRTDISNAATSFRIKNSIAGETIYSGLKKVIKVYYTHIYDRDLASVMLFNVNEKIYPYRIYVCIAQATMYAVPRVVDFGKINQGHMMTTRHIWIVNKGFRTRKFEFDLSHDELGITIMPSKGHIEPNQHARIELSLLGGEEGIFDRDIWVKCEFPFRVSINVEVIIPKLYICHATHENNFFKIVMFPPTYSNCSLVQNIRIFNDNMMETDFVIVPEFHNDVVAMDKIIKKEPSYNYFHFLPMFGHLQPSEKQSIRVIFSSSEPIHSQEKVYFLGFRIVRLEIIEATKLLLLAKKSEANLSEPIVESSNYASPAESASGQDLTEIENFQSQSAERLMDTSPVAPSGSTRTNYIRLCLCAVVKPLQVDVFPESFERETIPIYEKRTNFLVLFNRSESLPIYFQYIKVAYIDVEPATGRINSSSNVEITINIRPKSAGIINCAIGFKLQYYSQKVDAKSELVTIGKISVPLTLDVTMHIPTLVPKFNMGITPKHVNEVGYLTNDIRFNTAAELPRNAIVEYYKQNPEWRLNNAKIAFPNERPTSLEPWGSGDPECKTIFAGIPRVVAPPDAQYTFTLNELLKYTKNKEYYNKYLVHHQVCRLKHAVEINEPIDYEQRDKMLLKTITNLFCPAYYESKNKMSSAGFSNLTLIQTYFIQVCPLKIKLHKIAPRSKVKFQIVIKNSNSFAIKVMIKALHWDKSTFPNLPLTAEIAGSSKELFFLDFFPKQLGDLCTMIHVYLNTTRVVPLIFRAKILQPFIHLDEKELNFDESHLKQFKMHNLLNVPVEFNWTVPPFTCFELKPMSGVIPPMMYLYCEINYKPNPLYRTNAKFVCQSKQNELTFLTVNAFIVNCKVELQETVLEFEHVPLNLPFKTFNVLRNNDYLPISFKILGKPYPGITLGVNSGTIKCRSDFKLDIEIYFKYFATFEYKLEIEFEQGTVLSFIIKGAVDFPSIEFKPASKITFKTIPAESFDAIPFSVTNTGQSDVHISFDFSIYPELRVHEALINIFDEVIPEYEETLAPGESAHMYMSFYPLDVIMNDLYLPLVINRILGPPFKGEVESRQPYTFIKKNIPESVDEDFNLQIINCSGNKYLIPVLNIVEMSARHVLRFSKKSFKFQYCPIQIVRSNLTNTLTISNSSNRLIEFSINVDEIMPTFNMTWKNAPETTVDQYVVFDLKPEDELELIFTYDPFEFRSVVKNLPIHLREYKNSLVFCYIRLEATFIQPEFILPKVIHLKPVLLNVPVTETVTVFTHHHQYNCVVQATSENELLTVIMEKQNVFKNSKLLYGPKCYEVQLQFVSTAAIKILTRINFSCTCGIADFFSVIACADENLVTTYLCTVVSQPTAYTAVRKNLKFPYFPANDDESDYANSLRLTLKTVEMYLYHQIFHKTYYYFIPESMTELYRYPYGKRMTDTLTLVKLLILICGSEIMQFIANRPLPQGDELERISYTHSTYRNIINFVNEYGGYFPHVKARNLLTYNDYVIYMKKIRPEKQKSTTVPESREDFYLLTKQCWLDMVLQIYNTFILSRIEVRTRRISRLGEGSSTDFNSVSCASQHALILWLNKIFMNNVHELQELHRKNEPVPYFQITNLTTDLSNGLVLAVLTIHFCPYVKKHLTEIFTTVDSYEKGLHNTMQLTNIWKQLQCSFEIRPEDITNPSVVQMVMFVAYLYDTFPSFLPRDHLKFEVNLSTQESQEVIVKNTNAVDINFVIVFLDNNLGCFSTMPEEKLTVGPGKSAKLTVYYQAKVVEGQSATLILSGDVPGQCYSKNIVYTLIGSTTLSEAHTTNVLNVNLYNTVETDLTVSSPYKCECSYQIFVGVGRLGVNQQILDKLRKQRNQIKPRTIYTRATKLLCDNDGIGVLPLTLFSMSVDTVETMVLFTSKDVGDFFINIAVKPINFNAVEKMVLYATPPEPDVVCICQGPGSRFANVMKCPKRITVNIPCKNDEFWNIIAKSIMIGLPDADKPIWQEYLSNEMGTYLLKWMSVDEDDSPIKHVFNSNIKYTIINYAIGVKFPPAVVIDNIRSNRNVSISIHCGNTTNIQSKKIDFALQSLDGAEYRSYRIEFKKPRNTSSHKSAKSSKSSKSVSKKI